MSVVYHCEARRTKRRPGAGGWGSPPDRREGGREESRGERERPLGEPPALENRLHREKTAGNARFDAPPAFRSIPWHRRVKTGDRRCPGSGVGARNVAKCILRIDLAPAWIARRRGARGAQLRQFNGLFFFGNEAKKLLKAKDPKESSSKTNLRIPKTGEKRGASTMKREGSAPGLDGRRQGRRQPAA